MGDRLGTPGTADKYQSWAPSLGRVSQADGGGANSFKAFRLWESLDCVPDSLLATAAKCAGFLNKAQPCGAKKMAKSSKKGTAGN